MGDVYTGTATRVGRTVAIKVPRDEFSERYEREARAVGRPSSQRWSTLRRRPELPRESARTTS